MPRTQKYAVNESLVSLASSQQTGVGPPDDRRLFDHHRPSTIVSQKKISCGWFLSGIFGAASLAFILCVVFIRVPGVPQSRFFASQRIMQKKGFLKVYPYLPSQDTDMPGTYSIPLPIDLSQLRSIDNIISGYPVDSGDYSRCFVDLPSYNRPCYFEKKWLDGECNPRDDFGYREKEGSFSPCILVQIAESSDWSPVIYGKSDVDNAWKHVYDPTFASLGCVLKNSEGKTDSKSIKYFPSKGFSTRFFPVSRFNDSLYLPPSVMIRVEKIKVGDNITMECWLRAANAYLLADSGQFTISFLQNQDLSTETYSSRTETTVPSITDNNSREATHSTTTAAEIGFNMNPKN